MRDVAGAASTAAHAVGDLNHGLAAGGCGIVDVYRVLGELVVVADRLEQTTRDLALVVAGRQDAGGLGLSAGGSAHPDVDAAIDTLHAELSGARAAVGQFGRCLAAAQAALAAVTDHGPDTVGDW